jgi:Ca2+-binding RTX toxin-like protein
MATVNKTTVTDIYTGVLGLLPSQDAINWLTAQTYAGKPLDVAANLVLDAFKSRYSTGVDDANLLPSASDVDFVKAVYSRIFGLTAAELATQAEGVDYWTNWLKNPSAGADATNNYRGSLISTMLDVAIDKTQYVGNAVVEKARALLANREDVAEHYLQRGIADADVGQNWLRKVIGDVTNNIKSVESAKTVINGQHVANSAGVTRSLVALNGTDGDDRLFADSDILLNGMGGDDFLVGDDINNIIMGHAGNDYLIGGRGDDQLMGGTGNDTNYFARGDGKDTIIELGGDRYGTKDVIEFAAGITFKDVQLSRQGTDSEGNQNNDLVLMLKGSSDQISLSSYYADIGGLFGGGGIEELHFADGKVVDLVAVGAALQPDSTVDLLALLP